MSNKNVSRYKRTLFKEVESKIRHLRYNVKYSLEMLKTGGGGNSFRCYFIQF